MFKLRAPLVIEPTPQGTWQLIFSAGEAFDDTIPFRTMLAHITEALGQNSDDLRLSEYEKGEDFVEGTLKYGGVSLRVYYEYSLAYLALISDDKRVLEEVNDRLRRLAMTG